MKKRSCCRRPYGARAIIYEPLEVLASSSQVSQGREWKLRQDLLPKWIFETSDGLLHPALTPAGLLGPESSPGSSGAIAENKFGSGSRGAG